VSVPFGTSYIVKTIRLLNYENMVFDEACDALGDLERAQLMQEAVLFECFRLGVRYSVTPPAPLKRPWPYQPTRDGEVTGVRISISMRVTVAELMSMAATHVGVSEPLFIVGATLAYIGRLQSCYEGTRAASDDAARDTRAALRKIRLPERFRYPQAR
jgi:hypothetical protein